MASSVVAAAALMIGADFLGVQYWLNPSFEQTVIGEQRAITLEDGSLVQMNTATRLTVAFAPRARRVKLVTGEARFTVARNSDRPFIVTTPQASVRALGTVFNVRTAASGTAVAVLQGHVEVAARGIDHSAADADRTPSPGAGSASQVVGSRPHELDLFMGQRAAITPVGRIEPGAGPSLERVEAWTEGRLVFRNEALADLVAEFNRYHAHPLRIVDPGIAGIRVSGTFAADDLVSFEQFLERFEGVEIRTAPDGSEMLEGRAAN